MGAGKYNTKITVQQQTEELGPLGKKPGAWSEYISRWAKAVTVSATEGQDGDKAFNTSKYRLELMYDSEAALITESMRVSMGGLTLDIEGVLNVDQANREIHLFCKTND